MTKPRDPANRTGAAPPVQGAARATSSPLPRVRIDGWTARIAPFAIRRFATTYATAGEIAIDLALLDPGRHRLIAVHNFHVEDRNPRLDECVAGVFVAARRRNGAWEEPERFPIECRALAVLAEIAVPRSGGRGVPRLVAVSTPRQGAAR
jgi:hypothetical protein